MLDTIASGNPPRNALSVMQAIELKTSYAYSRPAQKVEVRASLEQLLTEAIGDPPALVEQEPRSCLAAPSEQGCEADREKSVTARPPIRRRKSRGET